MDKQQFNILVQKYIDGTATAEEISLIYQWYDSFDDTVLYVDDDETELKAKLWGKMNPGIPANQKQGIVIPIKRSANKRLWYAAAAVILVISVSALLVPIHHNNINPELSKAQKFKPVGNKAILTLSTGKTIVLGDTATTEVRDKNNKLVAVNTNKELNYKAENADHADFTETNTVTTPKGAQYKVVLPDGTKVWLNAASSITYPLAFQINERKVEMTGEAYFEVAKDATKPFRVLGNKQVVEVLGTHFNINAYTNEPYTNTTLLEGKVKVTSGGNQVLLTPGQQAQKSDAGLMVNQDADLDETTAWKDGYFTFNHEHIESVMRKIARWYDVDVEYEGAVSKDWFGGSVSRDKSAAELLAKLELTGQIHFKIEGRRVIVLQ